MQQESLFEEGEVILEKVRKHWIVYVGDFFLHAAGGVLFIGLAYFVLHFLHLSSITEAIASNIALSLIAFVVLFWTSFFYSWTKSYLDVWYITNQHIIAINQKEMFERDEAFMELSRIQDVFFEQEGFLSTFLGYGKLKVQSAGTEQEFIINYVHDVEQAAHKIMELRDEAHKGKPVTAGV